MVIYVAFFPRESTTYNVLVGLLTPKLNKARLLTALKKLRQWLFGIALSIDTCLLRRGLVTAAGPSRNRTGVPCLSAQKRLSNRQPKPTTNTQIIFYPAKFTVRQRVCQSPPTDFVRNDGGQEWRAPERQMTEPAALGGSFNHEKDENHERQTSLSDFLS